MGLLYRLGIVKDMARLEPSETVLDKRAFGQTTGYNILVLTMLTICLVLFYFFVTYASLSFVTR